MRKFLLLCLPMILAICLDFAVTIDGQPMYWWSGYYEAPNEANPVGYWVLQHGPVFAAWAALFYLVVWTAFVLILESKYAALVALVVGFGHLMGAYTWLLWAYEVPYIYARGTILATGILSYCVLEYICERPRT